MTRGEVVMVDWPFSDRTGSKVRPAIVVQADFLNTLIHDTVLIPVTKTSRIIGVTEVLIDPSVETASGLRFVSVASCNNFITIDQLLLRRKIGTLSGSVMKQIDACLKAALELP